MACCRRPASEKWLVVGWTWMVGATWVRRRWHKGCQLQIYKDTKRRDLLVVVGRVQWRHGDWVCRWQEREGEMSWREKFRDRRGACVKKKTVYLLSSSSSFFNFFLILIIIRRMRNDHIAPSLKLNLKLPFSWIFQHLLKWLCHHPKKNSF